MPVNYPSFNAVDNSCSILTMNRGDVANVLH